MLDTRQSVATPEGVDLSLIPAGPVPRATAYLIDLLVRGALMMTIGVGINMLGKFGFGLLLIVYFLVEWLYPVAFEVLARGATPGKRSVGLCVVEEDGRPVSLAASVIRNLLRAADMFPFLFGLGLLAMLFHPRFQRLGDMAAGTLVVWSPEAPQAPSLPPEKPVAPALPLRLTEQLAVIDFAERSARLSPARQEELADLLEPLTRARGETGVRRLRGLARWLVGER